MKTLGSLFSGIGGFDLGFERAGFKTLWQVEIEPFPRAVLATRFPDAGRFEDIKDCGDGWWNKHQLAHVDCITAGVPCQDVSVAGKRAGLKGKRTGLFYEFARILQELRPAWFVFENVPGLLSSNGGRDFAEVLRVLMVECRYGLSWRVLDSQFFGVAQRRRRVYIAGSFGRPCPGEILFESESRCGNPPKGRKARPGIAHALANSSVSSGYRYDANGEDYAIVGAIQSHTKEHGHAMSTQQAAESGQIIAHTLRESDGHHGRSSPRGDGCDNLVPTLCKDGDAHSGFRDERGIVVGTLKSHMDAEECADGFVQIVSTPPDPDGVRGIAGLPKGMDSARYRALGNAVTVQCAEWIARNIIQAEKGQS